MSKQKTLPTTTDPYGVIKERMSSEKKRKDGEKLLTIFSDISGYEPIVWGDSIIGFGQYEYEYQSGHYGTWPIIGFGPRRTKFSLYLSMKESDKDRLLEDFGKFTKGAGCIYINNLNDIDEERLKDLIRASLHYHQTAYKITES